MENFSYDYMPQGRELIGGEWVGEIDYEIIGGEKVYMVPAPNISHGIIVGRLVTMFNIYIWEHDIDAFTLADNADVYLADGSHFRPDVSVVVRKSSVINKEKFINGAPDLVVEVLSESTKKNDVGKKKDDYEKYGVKEYWIVDPENRSVTVYHNIEGSFTIGDEYKINTDKTSIKVSIFDDLTVDIRNIFKWWLD